jgi:hypothetical protein
VGAVYTTREGNAAANLDVPEERWYIYRVLSRRSWDELQALLESNPGSDIEHLEYGLFVLRLPSCKGAA